MSQNFNKGESDWLMQRYLSQQTNVDGDVSRAQSTAPPKVPTHSYASIHNGASGDNGLQGPKRDSTHSAPPPYLPTPPQEVTSQS